MKRWIFASAAVAALAGSGAQAQSTNSIADDAAAFGARDAVAAPRLSPDGSSVIYLTPGPGPKTFAVISNLQNGKTSVLTAADGNPERLHWCNYSAPDRVVCSVGGLLEREGTLLGFQRIIAMNTDGSDPKMLGQPGSHYDAGYRQYDGSILDWRDSRDGTVLMQREYIPEAGTKAIGSRLARTKSGLAVDLVDTRSAKSSSVEQPRDSASGYMTDGRGNVRLMTVYEAENNGLISGRVRYFYRQRNSSEWNSLVEFADYQDQIDPLAIDSDLDAVYILKKRNGRRALYTVKLDGSLAETLVAENPRVDIDGVVRIGDGQRVIGYSYADEVREVTYFDPEFKALADSLSKTLPDLPLIDFVDSTADRRKLLVFAGSDRDPGRYYIFDRDRKTLNEAMLERPQLEGRKLAEVRPVTITAADGAQIPGYLTLPPGKEAKGLPAVVFPHGGPAARDEWGFDWIAQFLAARGYAVLQPQFRGSAGYGDEWKNENAYKNWRTAISDIAASARWLASQGIADRDKMAIAGWSYGGYAALQTAATDPQLFKAVVAIAPVTDLSLIKRDALEYSNARVRLDQIGTGSHVVEGSPLRRAAAIQAPVLLVHGDMDANVRFWHSQKMYDALQGAGGQVEFLQYKGLDHQLRDSTARTEFLTRIGNLLERTIGD